MSNKQNTTWEIPEDFNMESKSRYMKFKEGDTKFRILDVAIFGYEWWIDTESGRKPMRRELGQEIKISELGAEDPKSFMAFPVYNYNEKVVQICELTQKTLMKPLKSYIRNEDYGNPTGYDITVTRSGEGMNTSYTLVASPPKPLSKEVELVWLKNPAECDALFINGDCFDLKPTKKDLERIAELEK